MKAYNFSSLSNLNYKEGSLNSIDLKNKSFHS